MPFGAYKVTAWGSGVNDAPVMPAGLTTVSFTQFIYPGITTQTQYSAATYDMQENRWVRVIGPNNDTASGVGTVRLWYTTGSNTLFNGQQVYNVYVSNLSSNLGGSLNLLTGASTPTFPFDIACSAQKGIGNGQYYGTVIGNYINTSAAAADTQYRRFTGWVSYAGPTALDATVFQPYSASSTPFGSTFDNVSIDCFGVFNNGGGLNNNYHIRTWFVVVGTGSTASNGNVRYGSVQSTGGGYVLAGALTSQTEITKWTKFKGVAFNNDSAGTDVYFVALVTEYTGSSNYYLGFFFVMGGSVYNHAIDTGIPVSTTSRQYPAKIWNGINSSSQNNAILACIINNQYLRLYKPRWNTGSFPSPATVTSSPLIYLPGPPNASYRIVETGIDGLAALFYLDMEDSRLCYYRWVTTTSDAQTVTLSNPIFLFNIGRQTIQFNVDMKYTSGGFQVIVSTTDWATKLLYNNVFYLWPQQTRSMYTNWNNQPMLYSLTPNAYTAGNIKRFGTSSLFCNQTGGPVFNYNVFNNCGIGTGDFTMEFYWYPVGSPISTYPTVFSIGNNTSSYFLIQAAKNPVTGSTATSNLYFTMSTTGTATSGNTISTLNSFSINNWYHIAIVRQSGVVTCYINGINEGSGTNTTDLNNSVFGSVPASIGVRQETTGSNTGFAYFDEFRFSNIARYTANFTAPTAPFSNDKNTCMLFHFNGTPFGMKFYDDWGPNYSA